MTSTSSMPSKQNKVEEIHNHKGKLIAVYVPCGFSPERTQFFTNSNEGLQFGIGVFNEGAEVKPHTHAELPSRRIHFQELIIIREGEATASLFDEKKEVVAKFDMVPGDCLLLLGAGHSFSFKKQTEVFELKLGPYSPLTKVLLFPEL